MITHVKNTFGKLFSFAMILFFVALGVLGVLLPILPGLVFLLIAALIAARHYPALGFLLERNRYTRKALRISNSFMDLAWWDKTKLCFWGTIKVSIDGLAWSISLLKRGGQFLVKRINTLVA